MALFLSEQALDERKDKMFLQAVNEAYFGRTPGTNALFNAYADWREPFVAKTKYFTVSGKNVYNDQYWAFLKKAKEQFGFRSISYSVEGKQCINSYTIGSIIPTRTSNMIEITKEGYRFKSDTNIHSVVAVYPDLVFSPDYTSEENFAIFLHEIGHNFQTAASQTVCSLTASSGIFKLMYDLITYGPLTPILTVALTSETIKGLSNELSNLILSNQVISNIISVTNLLTYIGTYGINLFFGIANFATRPVKLIYDFASRIVPFLINLISGGAAEGYYGERFADGFAASYGFGQDLQSALAKFGGKGISRMPIIDDTIGAIPVVSHLYAAACLPGMMLWGIIDPHPSFEARAYSILKDLKTDLNDPNLPPQMKSQLKKEIDDYEKSMTMYFTESKKLKNPSIVSAIFQEMIYTKCGGGTKFKLSELPYKNSTGGFRASVNADADRIMNTPIR